MTKILIVDDEPSIVNLVTAYLKPEGYEVYTAVDGPSGLKAARAFKPDLVVSETSMYSFRHLRMDAGARTVTVDENPIELTAIEFDLLKALVENRGRVLSREQLLEKVWGGEYFGEMRVVDVHLGHVRQKLGREDLIVTVRGVGYRFEDQPL